MSDTQISQQDEADLAAAKDEFKLSEDAYSDQRTRELADLRFESGDHYTTEELAYLRETKRPEVVMDQTSGQIAKVTNQPVHRIVVLPNGGGSDPTSAEYWQGICRRAEALSDGESVYRWGRRHVAVMGRGFWRVRADRFMHMERRADGVYAPDVFQQDIRIEPILFQHAVWEDPRTTTLDFSDMRFCHIGSMLDWDQARKRYPALKEHTASSLRARRSGHGDCTPEWANDKTLRVAERYWIEDDALALCLVKVPTEMRNPTTGLIEMVDVPTVFEKGKHQYPQQFILHEHTFLIPQVKWMTYVHGIVLDRRDVPGRYIPVVKIVGERRIIDGKEDNRGMVRMAKTPQRHVNLYEARLASAIDLSAEGTWHGSVRAIGQWQEAYANAHRDRPGVLMFNDTDDSEVPIAPPTYVAVAPAVQHLVMAAQRAGMNLRAVLGTPDVAPDETRREQSGVAIGRRQAEQAQATSHYGDSTKSGVRHTGRIVWSMGRKVYDVPRILRINGKDEKEIALVVSRGTPDDAALQRLGLKPGQIEHMLNVDAGEFDFTVTAGQVKETQRQERVELIGNILPMLPPPMQVKAAGAMLRDIDGLHELAEQLAPEGESGMVPVEQLEQLKQEATKAVQMREQKIQDLQRDIDGQVVQSQSKEKIAKYETDAKVQMNRDEMEGQFRVEELKQAHETQRAAYQVEMARLQPIVQPQASPEFGG